MFKKEDICPVWRQVSGKRSFRIEFYMDTVTARGLFRLEQNNIMKGIITLDDARSF